MLSSIIRQRSYKKTTTNYSLEKACFPTSFLQILLTMPYILSYSYIMILFTPRPCLKTHSSSVESTCKIYRLSFFYITNHSITSLLQLNNNATTIPTFAFYFNNILIPIQTVLHYIFIIVDCN